MCFRPQLNSCSSLRAVYKLRRGKKSDQYGFRGGPGLFALVLKQLNKYALRAYFIVFIFIGLSRLRICIHIFTAMQYNHTQSYLFTPMDRDTVEVVKALTEASLQPFLVNDGFPGGIGSPPSLFYGSSRRAIRRQR